jgi:hypothetical protein
MYIKKREEKKFADFMGGLLKPKSEFKVSDKTDEPVAFGYKNLWFAVKTNNKEQLAGLLDLDVLGNSNWQNGVEQAYDNRVFITPEVDGWTLVCGDGLLSLVEKESADIAILNKLSAKYGEAQYFYTHRVTEYHIWAKSLNGKVIRYYSYMGERGENMRVEGEPSEAEKGLKLINTFSVEAKAENYFEREDLVIPDESMVMAIAKAWSISPVELPVYNNSKKEFGIVCVKR